jgi:hypothetical protein
MGFELLLVLVIVLLGVLVVNTINNIIDNVKMFKHAPEIVKCSLHSWSYYEDDTGTHMQCTECNHRPNIS